MFTATVTWAQPTVKSDGTPLLASEIKGYLVEYQSGSGTIEDTFVPGTNTTNARTFDNLPLETFSARVSCQDNFDNFGQPSAWMSIDAPAVPGVPSDVTITLG